MDAALLFENDAYRLDGPKLMGRQAAGNGFLRAAVGANRNGVLWGFSTYGVQADAFRKTVTEIDPSVRTEWITRRDFKRMGERQVLFRPDGELRPMADLRLRVGPGRYSLCGITHTLSGATLEMFAGYARAPLAPWDALICTSRAAVSVIEEMYRGEDDYLAWRFGQRVTAPRPQLPIIPLGVHVADFEGRAAERPAARAMLGLAEGEVAALFAGRLSFHAKAHPYQMYAALQEAARRTGKKLALIMAGQAPNAAVMNVLLQGMAAFCPDVRPVVVDGKDFERYAAAWAAADIFVSLSDNIQETFGITPVEAMASGLPVIVTDWDGYKDTIVDGEVGFRVPTYAPAPGHGADIASGAESGEVNYDFTIFRACMAVGAAGDVLADRLTALVQHDDLRRQMGEAGRRRAAEVYDWPVVYRQYQALWDELNAIRQRESGADYWAAAPRNAPWAADPFVAFRAFPTGHIDLQTRVGLVPGATLAAHDALAGHGLFEHFRLPAPLAQRTFAKLAAGEATVAELASAAQTSPSFMVEAVGRLFKMNLVRLA